MGINEDKKSKSVTQKKSCTQCGAELLYKPGTNHIHCDYCGHIEEINIENKQFEEHELKPYLDKHVSSQSSSQKLVMLACKSCGAHQHIEEHYKSLQCVYCASPLILEDSYTEDWILPGAIVPFAFDQQRSHQIFTKWVKGLWFAPNKIKKATLKPQNTKGLYVPYWTFDAKLYASYSGERGQYYYVNVPYTTQVNGKTVSSTKQEQRVQWTSVNGHVEGFLDDLLVKASHQHKNVIPKSVANWNLNELKAFDTDFLAGFVTEKYTISLKDGHLASTQKAKNVARSWARHKIGGDIQRVHSLQMSLSEETFKHVLLPVYISTYEYQNKKYNFFVNGQTGNISGKRPYSFWKIFFFITIIILILASIWYLTKDMPATM